ncbi:MAG: hypothetical protein JO108_24145 [Acidobacteriaceae bacterium]|nr:hypothetical protein [Acidobacteriaceae bacterium]
MTFDELWRQNDGEDARTSPLNMPAQPAFPIDSSVAGSSGLEDLDETEINRFLDWLETGLQLDDFGEWAA